MHAPPPSGFTSPRLAHHIRIPPCPPSHQDSLRRCPPLLASCLSNKNNSESHCQGEQELQLGFWTNRPTKKVMAGCCRSLALCFWSLPLCQGRRRWRTLRQYGTSGPRSWPLLTLATYMQSSCISCAWHTPTCGGTCVTNRHSSKNRRVSVSNMRSGFKTSVSVSL